MIEEQNTPSTSKSPTDQGRADGAGAPTMVERVARAICASLGGNPDAPFVDRHGATQPYPWWVTLEGEARAAIEAMREPTEGMVRVTIPINPCQSRDGQCYDEAEIYRAMIDAALSPPPPTPPETETPPKDA